MPKRKGGKSKGYISKKQRPNVSKSIKKDVRRHSHACVKSLLQSQKDKEIIIRSFNQKDKERAVQYKIEDQIYIDASRLWNKFSKCGMQWSQAVQAVKTNYITETKKKWLKILQEWLKEQEENKVLFAK